MEKPSVRHALSGGIILAALGPGPAPAQETLPDIEIAAPSPIQRRAPATAQAATPETRGVLPIVADQFATVTVVDSDEIRRSGGATLGDLLFSKPGITGSSFAPGAASRPVVRGLDAHRVRIQENGLGSSGVSELGEDHEVPLDPLGVGRIEVVRGPATLRWGSQAIGGVVNATNNRIPEALPCRGGEPSPGPCTRLETRSAVSTVDAGLEQAALVDVGQGNFALHADAHGRRASDYAIPSYPYLTPTDPAPLVFGRQPNSYHALRRLVGRRLLYFRSRLFRRRGDAIRERLPHPRHGFDGEPHAHPIAADESDGQGRISAARLLHRRHSRLGRRDRL